MAEITAICLGRKKIKIVLRFHLDQFFPVLSSTSFSALSTFSGFSVMHVRRVVRHAILNYRLFEEKTPGVITHSALTAVLAGDENARNSLVVYLYEFWSAGAVVRLVES
jgi:hypothetical protein